MFLGSFGYSFVQESTIDMIKLFSMIYSEFLNLKLYNIVRWMFLQLGLNLGFAAVPTPPSLHFLRKKYGQMPAYLDGWVITGAVATPDFYFYLFFIFYFLFFWWGGHHGGKMCFWGGKNQKNCWFVLFPPSGLGGGQVKGAEPLPSELRFGFQC